MDLSPKTLQDLIDYAAELCQTGQQAAADEICNNLLACPIKFYAGMGFAPVTLHANQ